MSPARLGTDKLYRKGLREFTAKDVISEESEITPEDAKERKGKETI
jgi:phage FluMu protein gp41